MEQLAVRTAIPFGYLIIFVLFFISSLSICGWVYFSVKARPIKHLQFVTSTFLLAFLLLVAWSNIKEGAIEWNPIIKGNKPLIGTWETDGSKLVLQQNGYYSYSGTLCNHLGTSGKWHRFQDFEIEFVLLAGQLVRWRIAKQKGNYQFISGAIGDPDMWQTHVSFTKQNSP